MAARIICLITGCLASLLLFISPVPTFIEIIRKGRTGRFSVQPYVAIWAYSTVWMFYGLPIVEDNVLPLAVINGIGSLVTFVYISIFLWHSKLRKIRCALICISFVIVLVASMILVLVFFPSSYKEIRESWKMNVGINVIVTGFFISATPFALMVRDVIQQRACRIKSVPFLVSLSLALNGICWYTYGRIVSDEYIRKAHEVGTLLAIAQLVIWLWVASCRALCQPQRKREPMISASEGV